jgi:hypothetical protein
MKAVALVLVLGAASTWIHTVLSLKILWKFIDIDRLYVATDGVLHLDPVARVLKGNPLHAVLVLSYN